MVRHVATFFSPIGDEALITIVVECNDDEWKKLLDSEFSIVYNVFVKAIGLVYSFDRNFAPGIVIDTIDTAKMMVEFLRNAIKRKRYSVAYLRITNAGVMYATAIIPIQDTKIFEGILADISKLLEREKK